MKIVIGKISQSDSNNIEACKIVDVDTKKVEIISYNNIKKLISNEMVIGFKVNEINNYTSDKNRYVIKKDKGRFTFNKVPDINGKGELVNPEDSKYVTVFAWKGFAEAKTYFVFDHDGNVLELDVDKFEDMVRKDLVNGASINQVNGKITIKEELKRELC